jgi:signal transduction histidine kinase
MSQERIHQLTVPCAAVLLLAGLAITVADADAGVLALALLVLGGTSALITLARHAAVSGPPASSPIERPGGTRPVSLGLTRAAYLMAGTAMVGGLALGQVHGVGTTLPVELSLAGLAASIVMLGPEVVVAVRRLAPAAVRMILALMLLALVVTVGVLVRGAIAHVVAVAVLLVIAGAGLVLVADALGALVRGTAGRGSVRRQATVGGDRTGRGSVIRGAVGALMVVWAGVLGIVLAGTQSSGHTWLVVLFAIAIVIAVVVLLGIPLLIASVTTRRRLAIDRLVDVQRQRISADLHDSVLQTLALVQRQATDPVAVARLARRQEHALRSWMAGETHLTAGSLAGAIRDIASEVEDDLGLVVALSVIGDRSTVSGDEVLLAALREALRNVARHAAGSAASVFSEISVARVEVYVLDTGPGFVPDEVPRARRGIRDAIVGRMVAVGGSAEINSVPGQGTDVLLRLPAS